MSCHLDSTNNLSRTSGIGVETAGITMAAWFRWTTATPAFNILYSIDDGGAHGLQLGANNDGTTSYGIFYAGVYTELIHNPGLTWHFTALTCLATGAPGVGTANVKAYVGDGSTSLTSVTYSQVAQGTGNKLWIGQDGFADGGNGDYLGFRYWDRRLSDADVANEYRRIMPASMQSLNTWLPLLNAQGPGVNRAGSGANMTVAGTPTDSASMPFGVMMGGRRRG